MKRPIGAMALAILTFLQGVYGIYVTLIYLGIVELHVPRSDPSRSTNAQWGRAVLSGVVTLVYFAVSYGFWNVRIWSWMYGLLISSFNLIWLFFAVLGERHARGRARPDAA